MHRRHLLELALLSFPTLARAGDAGEVDTVGHALKHGGNVLGPQEVRVLLPTIVLSGNELATETRFSFRYQADGQLTGSAGRAGRPPRPVQGRWHVGDDGRLTHQLRAAGGASWDVLFYMLRWQRRWFGCEARRGAADLFELRVDTA